MPIRDFAGKVAVVTGAAGGIGYGLARALVDAGSTVVLADRDPSVREAAAGLGPRATGAVCDVSRAEAVDALATEVLARHGAVHLLVNNAGVSVAGRFEDVRQEDLEWLFAVNFFGTVHGCRAFLPHLRQQSEAHLVNVCSSFAWLGFPGKSAYSASKAAVRALSESLRAELTGGPVGVTVLFPGPVDTALVREGRAVDPAKRDAEAAFLARRGVPVERVARRCLRGIRRNAARVVVSLDYCAIDAAVRLAPSAALDAMARLAPRMPF